MENPFASMSEKLDKLQAGMAELHEAIKSLVAERDKLQATVNEMEHLRGAADAVYGRQTPETLSRLGDALKAVETSRDSLVILLAVTYVENDRLSHGDRGAQFIFDKPLGTRVLSLMADGGEELSGVTGTRAGVPVLPWRPADEVQAKYTHAVEVKDGLRKGWRGYWREECPL